jgi:hypothetical protein
MESQIATVISEKPKFHVLKPVLEDSGSEKSSMLEKLKDSELHLNLKNLVTKERELLYEILLHIAEVDRRKLYLAMAYPSLWEYMLSLGYSESSAYRRIQAARLLNRVPEIGIKIEEGSINLSQACELEKIDQKHLPKLIEKLEYKSKRETQIILAQELDLPIKHVETQKAQKDESIRIELTFSKEEWEQIKAAKDLLAHALKDQDTKTLINHLVTKELRKSQKSTSAAKVILNRDKTCQFKDPRTHKQCNSKHLLQVDHIQPKYAGGSDDQSNLRILCAHHNRYRCRKDFGQIRKSYPEPAGKNNLE